MALTLTSDHIAMMQTHAEQAYPEEGCGLIAGRWDVIAGEKIGHWVHPLANAWSPTLALELDDLAVQGGTSFCEADGLPAERRTKNQRYWIDPQDFLRIQREARDQGLSIIGVFHSHPDGVAVPSACDRTLAWPDYAYIILAVSDGKTIDIQNWQLDEARQFQPEPLKIVPASAAKDRMPSYHPRPFCGRLPD